MKKGTNYYTEMTIEGMGSSWETFNASMSEVLSDSVWEEIATISHEAWEKINPITSDKISWDETVPESEITGSFKLLNKANNKAKIDDKKKRRLLAIDI